MDYNVGQLREVAKIAGVHGYYNMNKKQIIAAINDSLAGNTVKTLHKVAFFLRVPAYSKLRKSELIEQISQQLYSDEKELNRIQKALQRLPKNADQDYAMYILFGQLTPSYSIQPGKHYFYIYKAKTPGIVYDLHPLITCTEITDKGWFGYNYHWEKRRQYTYPEVRSNFYEVYENELEDAKEYPCAKYLNN